MALLASCYSLTGWRVEQRVVAEDRAAVLALWCRMPSYWSSDPDKVALQGLAGLVWWPFDALFSASVAVRAPFDETLEVRGGPAGAVVAICLPWFTLLPNGVMTPHFLVNPPAALELTAAEFDQLLERVRRGDGVEAYRALENSPSTSENVHAVLSENVYALEVLDGPHGESTGR